MSEATKRIERAKRMIELCEDTGGLWDIIEGIGQSYAEQWAKSLPSETDKREQIYHRMHALKDVKAAIERVIADGNNAAAEQEAKARAVGTQFF